jgi:serine protease
VLSTAIVRRVAAGHALRTLVSGSYPVGVHTVHWNGLDATGRPVANGVYFFRLKARGESQTVKGVWVR